MTARRVSLVSLLALTLTACSTSEQLGEQDRYMCGLPGVLEQDGIEAAVAAALRLDVDGMRHDELRPLGQRLEETAHALADQRQDAERQHRFSEALKKAHRACREAASSVS